MTPPTEQGHGALRCRKCGKSSGGVIEGGEFTCGRCWGAGEDGERGGVEGPLTYLPESAVRELREWARAEHENWFATAEDRAGRDQYAEGAADTYELVADKLDALLNNDQKGEGSDGTE